MTTALTAKQHRTLAANLLKTAGKPGHPNKTRAKQMAKYHEILAKMIEQRAHCRNSAARQMSSESLKIVPVMPPAES